jgi:hypothetical protein
MNMKMKVALLSLAIVAAAVAVNAQTVPLDIEAGVRFTSVDGNRDMYKTQINEQGGFLIRSLTYNTVDFGGAFSLVDHFRLDISDLGAGPAGSLRLDTGKTGSYRFKLAYRVTNDFSSLPAFANPMLAQGITPGQHTYNRDRHIVDADLEFLRFTNFSPFVGYSFNRWAGPGTTSYHVGQDEFLLGSQTRDTDNEFRLGTTFDIFHINGQVTQGWRHFRSSESLSLIGPTTGNNTTPVLGSDNTATSIQRDSRISGKTPFTNAFATTTFGSRVRLTGNYVRFEADSSGPETDSVGGNLASFEISRFFNGLSEQTSSSAKNNTWRGGAQAEVALIDNVDLLAGWQREHRDLSGSALIGTIYFNSITFGGADPRDLATVINANSSLKRDIDTFNASVVARAVGPFSFRAGFVQTKEDVNVAPDLAEIVVPGPSEGGSFSRRVNTIDLTGSFASHGFTLGASYKRDHANDPILRTDFINRDRIRARAAWAGGPHKLLRIGAVAEKSTPKNDREGFAYNGRIATYSGDIAIVPTEKLRLYGSASRYRADTTILYRRPENFAIDTSYHKENGRALEGGVSYDFARVGIDTGLSRFTNIGTSSFTIDRYHARATFDIRGNAGIAAEWDLDKYAETSLLGDYNANRYGIYLRWRQ